MLTIEKQIEIILLETINNLYPDRNNFIRNDK